MGGWSASTTPLPDQERMREVLQNLGMAAPGSRASLCARDGESDAVSQITMVRLRDHPSWDGPEPRIGLFVSSTAALKPPDVRRLQDHFDLTRVEAEVVSHICCGCDPAEVARRMRVSVHTVRGHLKTIYQKMNVHRQSDVVRAVWTTSSLVRS
jgi:DNA-binding CsgD family transcriptional regulator